VAKFSLIYAASWGRLIDVTLCTNVSFMGVKDFDDENDDEENEEDFEDDDNDDE